ncbi:MAG: branched-chain amino acid ABC transporter permease [Pseudomonadota bacterium]
MGKKKSLKDNFTRDAELAAGLLRGPRKERNWLDFLMVAGAFLLLTPILSTHRVTDFMIFCIFALSFGLMYGYMGRLSFGHLLFLGTGAYCSGLFINNVNGNPFLAILVGIIAAGLLGMVLGIVIVRTTGACFSLINLAFNHIGFFLVLSPLKGITNGEDGFGVHASSFWFLDPASKVSKYFFVLLCLLLVFYLLKRLTSSPYGIMIRSIKEDETRVRFLGYNTYFYKWLTYVLASSLAGLAGTLTALNYNYVNPNVMDVHSNVGAVFACLIGGAGSLYGVLVGSVAYMLISNYLPLYIQRWEMFLGISLLIIVFRFRKGIWGNIQDIWDYYKKQREARVPMEEEAIRR